MRWNVCRISGCSKKITLLLALLAVTLVVTRLLPVSLLPIALPLSWTLLALAIIDFRTMLLPDVLTLPLLWCGLLSNAAGFLSDLTLSQAVYGAAGGYIALWLISRTYFLLSRREGLGLGDAKLLAALGAWLGPGWLPWVVLLASFIATAAIGVARLKAKRALHGPFPFGPALAFSGWAIFLWQNGSG